MYHVSAQGVDERMINVHYYRYYIPVILFDRFYKLKKKKKEDR